MLTRVPEKNPPFRIRCASLACLIALSSGCDGDDARSMPATDGAPSGAADAGTAGDGGSPPSIEEVHFLNLPRGELNRVVVHVTDPDGDVDRLHARYVEPGWSGGWEHPIGEGRLGQKDFWITLEFSTSDDPAAQDVWVSDLRGQRSATRRVSSLPLPVRAAGEPCDPDARLDACAPGHACLGTPASCGATLPLGAGERCDPRDLTLLCAAGLLCAPSTGHPGECMDAAAARRARCAGAPELVLGGSARGAIVGLGSWFAASCATGSFPEDVYRLHVAAPGRVQLSVDPATPADTVLFVRGSCDEPASELACNDDRAPEPEGVTRRGSELDVSFERPGDYFVFVGAKARGWSYDLVASLR